MTAPDREDSAVVSLRRFAALVPMPYNTARDWRDAEPPRIKATRTATGRWLVTVDQLGDVREALGLPRGEVPA